VKTIRVDSDVRDALLARRLPGERNYNGAISRTAERAELESRLEVRGAFTSDEERNRHLRTRPRPRPAEVAAQRVLNSSQTGLPEDF